jgi:hypothetical protein
MADFFFFTDVESILSQEIGDNFGPISDTEYNLDSFQTVSENANAYAICDSLVLVQENNDGHLNIILKPLTYPDFNIGRIEYFIYKGIKKSSLINGNEVAIRTSNDLTENLWLRQEQTDKNSGSTPSNPLKKHLGVDYISSGIDVFKITDEQSIESVFFKEGDIQLAKVKGGDSIGQFVGGSTKCGVQIIVERVGFYPPMELARKGKHKLNITEPIGTTQYQQFLHYHLKEEILNYIDPVSFLGMFSQSKNKLIIKSLLGSTIELPNLIQKFQNKNRIYLDIRNEYDKSFNYYQLYGPLIGFSTDPSLDATSITQYNFYTQNATSTGNYGLWPIFIIEGEPILEFTENQKHGKLFLNIKDPNNILKYIYFIEARLNGNLRSNKFDYEINFSEHIFEISSWVYGNGNKIFGCSYLLIKIAYDRTNDYPGLFVPGQSTLDHLFSFNDLKITCDLGPFDLGIKVFQNGSVIEKIEYPEVFGNVYGAQIGLAKDVNSFIFYSSPNYDIGFLRDKSIKSNITFVSGVYKDKVDFFYFLSQLSDNIDFEMDEFDVDDQTISTLRLQSSGSSPISNFLDPALLDCIQISHSEYDDIISLINSNDFIKEFGIYLGTNEEETYYQNITDYCFKQTYLTIEGLSFVPNSNNTQIQKKVINTDIIINSIVSNIL